jgi:hypothetical protein
MKTKTHRNTSAINRIGSLGGRVTTEAPKSAFFCVTVTKANRTETSMLASRNTFGRTAGSQNLGRRK